ncbi:C40 family peptidase [Streptacidiphilus fuscans]|uniref:Peptidoglycan-binding protein n=1 Tax=Streptacidiphilus fuscans TaxID=2789292 RepID=A0A931B8Z4_9ACTN|nr:peptidoglycan-binding protein [Streptacidiphilus fuscans]MBF9069075.1 peptidoglycan-binding protein [Streptacidiphilus fuscans]
MNVLKRRPHRLLRRVLLPVSLGAVLAGGLAVPAFAAPGPIDLNSSSCPANMTGGENDGCVTELQTLLNTHGFRLTVDGDFGNGTLAAVRTFQSETGIAVDGQVGPQTKAELYVSSTSVPDPIDLESSSCPANITGGEVSGCVTELQDLLNAQGAHLSIDGDFGNGTLAAVEAFQSAHKLSVDGQVGTLTKDALYGTSNVTGGAVDLRSASCPANMTQGEVDGCVTALQSLLDAHGASLSVDGGFGPLTFSAVESFQSANGLSVDGQVGPQTKAALYDNVSTSVGAPAPIALNSSSCPANMTEGEIDGCVTSLQSFLNTQGQHLAVDGDFGAHTFAAVEAFQAANSLSVDGQVGPATKAKILYEDGVYHCPSTGCPGQNQAIQPYVVQYAAAMAKQGTMPYVYAGGHGASPGPSVGYCSGTPGTSSAAGYLQDSNGTWYCFASHHVGLDCSGFARLMYYEAAGYDVLGSGATNDQIKLGNQISSSQAVPGDLIFFGTSTSSTDHVGIYAGVVNGVPMMYNAFDTGTNVREEPVSDAQSSDHPNAYYTHYDAYVSISV